MIPVLGVPVLNKVGLLDRMLRTVDTDVDMLYMVDNGGILWDHYRNADSEGILSYEKFNRVHITDSGYNVGVAASWNLIIKANIGAPWWLIANNDIVLSPGSLDKLVENMNGVTTPRLCVIQIANEDWGNHFGAFAVNAAAIDTVGWFDENFYPIYFEDTDWMKRAALAEVSRVVIPSSSHHDGNESWKNDQKLSAANSYTWNPNRDYFDDKWGMLEEPKYAVPFNRAEGTIKDWLPPSVARLRDQTWPVLRGRGNYR